MKEEGEMNFTRVGIAEEASWRLVFTMGTQGYWWFDSTAREHFSEMRKRKVKG